MPMITAYDRDGTAYEIDAQEGISLMEVLRDEGLPVAALCGGCCSCATCHGYLDDDSYDRLTPPLPEEDDLLEGLEHRQRRSRLTCQIPITEACDGLTITLAPEEP